MAVREVNCTVFNPEVLAARIKEDPFPVVGRGASTKTEGSEWLQKGSRSPVVLAGDRIEGRNELTPEEVAFYKTPEGIVDFNSDGIELALDRRVALFFQQAILCYKMPFVFTAKGADDQIGSASNIHLSSADKTINIVHKREAAHSSTLPTLYAHPKGGDIKDRFVYLKGGSSHAQHNATIGMHECVNGADELIDGKEKGLRVTALKILNLVADGLDPVTATKQFIVAFKTETIACAEKLKGDDKRRAVLEAYRNGMEGIEEAVNRDPLVFDRLIGVTVEPGKEVVREVVYERRYKLICLQEAIESRIGKRVANAQGEMRSSDKSLLELCLLANAGEKKVLEKLFAKTSIVFEKEYGAAPDQKTLKSFLTRIKNLKEKYKTLIQNLERDIRADLRELSSAEFIYRSCLFKDLRTRVRSWTQFEFCEQHLQATGVKVSQSWVSRMEQPSRVRANFDYKTPVNQRSRPVTIEDAKRCAETFGIDPGLFLPCLVTSA